MIVLASDKKKSIILNIKTKKTQVKEGEVSERRDHEEGESRTDTRGCRRAVLHFGTVFKEIFTSSSPHANEQFIKMW